MTLPTVVHAAVLWAGREYKATKRVSRPAATHDLRLGDEGNTPIHRRIEQ